MTAPPTDRDPRANKIHAMPTWPVWARTTTHVLSIAQKAPTSRNARLLKFHLGQPWKGRPVMRAAMPTPVVVPASKNNGSFIEPRLALARRVWTRLVGAAERS